MKRVLFAMGFAALIVSCGSTKKDETTSEKKAEPVAKSSKAAAVENPNGNALTPVLDAYLDVKDALVNDNQEGAAKAGGTLAVALGSLDLSVFPASQQKELKDIVEVAKNHGEHISESEIGHQREHFEALSKDIKDLAGIIGTDRTLYHQFCPMYDGNKGGMWLSANEEVRNPLFGSSMLKCGRVEEVIKL